MKIAGIGELLWDCLPTGKQIGGAPLNFASHALMLGAESYIISAVGRDALGDELLRGISETGVDISLVQRNALPTSRVEVELDANGVPRYNICEGVAWDDIEVADNFFATASRFDAVCWGSLAQRTETSKRTILQLLDSLPKKCLKIFDVNLRQNYYSKELLDASLGRADILKLNEDELPVLASMYSFSGASQAILAAMIEHFRLQYIIYTKGGNGSDILSDKGVLTSMPSPTDIEIVNTVGAGDSFTAAVAVGILSGAPQTEFHHKAVDVATFVCTQKDATPKLPEYLSNY